MIDFPSAPVTDQEFTDTNGTLWKYTGQLWRRQGVVAAAPTGLTISDTPPPNPVDGDQWFASSLGVVATWYEDGDSGQWVSDSLEGSPPEPIVPLFFASTEVQMTNAMSNVQAHGLGGMPTNFSMFLVCQNASDGYAAGDMVKLNARFGTGSEPVTASVDETNVTMIGGAGIQMQMPRKDTGASFTIASGNANFFMKVHAWREVI